MIIPFFFAAFFFYLLFPQPRQLNELHPHFLHLSVCLAQPPPPPPPLPLFFLYHLSSPSTWAFLFKALITRSAGTSATHTLTLAPTNLISVFLLVGILHWSLGVFNVYPSLEGGGCLYTLALACSSVCDMCAQVLTCQLHCSWRTLPERFTTLVGQGTGGGRGESVGRGEGEKKGGGVKQSRRDNPRARYQQGRVMGRVRRCLRHLEPEPRGPLSAAAGVSECRHPLQ